MSVRRTSERLKSFQLVGIGYVLVLVFLFVFALSLVAAPSLNLGLANPIWALMIALLAILPPLLPGLLRYVVPRIKSLGIPGFFEVSFSEVEVASYSPRAVTALPPGTMDTMSAPEYASLMTSHSSTIVAAVKELQMTRDEVLVVDLGVGRSWIPPNLYFLAWLAALRTSARQVVFVEMRQSAETFVGMCFPDELVDALGRKFPELEETAKDPTVEQSPLDSVGIAYFQVLANLYSARGEYRQVGDTWLTSVTLIALLGTRIHRQLIEWKDPLTEADYRQIILSDYPYTAAVDSGRLMSIISQERVALLLAKELMKIHS